MAYEWEQYEKHIDLYKFYIEAAIKINVFHYAITGAITSFYFANLTNPDIEWALVLPAFLSMCLAFLFAYGAKINLITRKDILHLGANLGLSVVPEVMVLTVTLVIFFLAHLITGFGLIYLILKS